MFIVATVGRNKEKSDNNNKEIGLTKNNIRKGILTYFYKYI